MKPKNFPERKNARRKAAFERMTTRRTWLNEQHDVEYAALNASMVDSARHVRTKKHGTREQRQAAFNRGS